MRIGAEDVVEIAGDRVHRHITRRDAKDGGIRKGGGQQRKLDAASQIKLFLNLAVLLFALERAPRCNITEASQQNGEAIGLNLERAHQVVQNTEYSEPEKRDPN